MCAECEPRVLGKLEDAGYTAKTDFLRRMMDRSRLNRGKTKKRTSLDIVEISGKCLWWSGLVLQLVWHLAAISAISEVHATDESRAWISAAVRGLHHLYRVLPVSDKLAWRCFQVTVLASWWNPKFAQAVRGFSRPILGLPHWYIFQCLIALIRFTFPKFMNMGLHGRDQQSAQLAAHLCVALLSSYVSYACHTRWLAQVINLCRLVSSPGDPSRSTRVPYLGATTPQLHRQELPWSRRRKPAQRVSPTSSMRYSHHRRKLRR